MRNIKLEITEKGYGWMRKHLQSMLLCGGGLEGPADEFLVLVVKAVEKGEGSLRIISKVDGETS